MLLNHLLPLLPRKVFCLVESAKVQDERGLGTIEMVILLAVLIGLAFMFKGFIGDIFKSITEGINTNDLGNASKLAP